MAGQNFLMITVIGSDESEQQNGSSVEKIAREGLGIACAVSLWSETAFLW
jgi:hypothetical protein